MKYNITINKVKTSRVSELDFNNISLGKTFTDHMFICEYENNNWQNPRIEPLALIPTHPAAMSLHYGQAIFEGMKATLNAEGTPMLFRPEKNAKRLNLSAQRIGMPDFPEDLFIEALKQFVAIEHDWIPTQKNSALYLRPFMFADEAFIGMRAATRYKFMIIASPAGPFFSKRIKLFAENKFVRACKGGTGEAKVAGNYAAAIRPTELAKAKGYDQVLWLDSKEFKYIQEAGTMNIFFHINNVFVTPKLDGSVLNGITRMTVIDILKDMGHTVEERLISIDEVLKAAKNGTLKEAFGTGTAVGIAMIAQIGYKGEDVKMSDLNPVGQKIHDRINNVRCGLEPDVFNWMVPVK